MKVNNLMHGLSRTILPILFIASLLSCRKDRDNDKADPALLKTFERLADNGSLLNSYSLVNGVYIFKFETEEIRVPAEEIGQIQDQADKWKTLVTLRGGR